MTRRAVALSLAVFVCTAAAARPEAVAIDHKAVGCIVVGKYPKMNACFTPTAELARSRVYFRPEGVPSWYYVEMKSDQPCFTGTLPRPGKKLVGKKIEYYLEAQNKAFEPARTAEFDPIVVKSAQECKKNVPVAPFLNNATVAVFPAVPAGFVGGGIGTAAIVGIVGAGAAAAGTAAVVASNNNNDTTTTTIAAGVNTTTTVAVTTTTTTTTTLPSTNHPPFAVLTTKPDPPTGQGPLTVTFDLCKSTDPDNDPLSFFFDFGDGGKASGSCLESHTYSATFRGASNVRALDRSYTAEACAVDTGGLSACRTRNVLATSPPPPTTMKPCLTPTIFVTDTKSSGCDFFMAGQATNADGVNICATPVLCPFGSGGAMTCAAASLSGNFFNGVVTVTSSACYNVTATATNACGGTATTGAFPFIASCSPFRDSEASTVLWSSDLKVEGARLQVILNGSAASYPARGRSSGTARLKDGENRVEATVVDGAGKAGTWRIELLGSESLQAGSIRVLAGDVESISATAVTFRLKGTPGERVAFTFAKKK